MVRVKCDSLTFDTKLSLGGKTLGHCLSVILNELSILLANLDLPGQVSAASGYVSWYSNEETRSFLFSFTPRNTTTGVNSILFEQRQSPSRINPLGIARVLKSMLDPATKAAFMFDYTDTGQTYRAGYALSSNELLTVVTQPVVISPRGDRLQFLDGWLLEPLDSSTPPARKIRKLRMRKDGKV